MTDNLRRFLTVPLALLSGLATGCPPCQERELAQVNLAGLEVKVEQTVVVRLWQGEHGETEDPTITCTWGSAAAGEARRWACIPPGESAILEVPGVVQPIKRRFVLPDPRLTWLIEIAGPSTTQTFTRAPSEVYPGEESCSGSTFEVEITADDLRAVGAVAG